MNDLLSEDVFKITQHLNELKLDLSIVNRKIDQLVKERRFKGRVNVDKALVYLKLDFNIELEQYQMADISRRYCIGEKRNGRRWYSYEDLEQIAEIRK